MKPSSLHDEYYFAHTSRDLARKHDLLKRRLFAKTDRSHYQMTLPKAEGSYTSSAFLKQSQSSHLGSNIASALPSNRNSPLKEKLRATLRKQRNESTELRRQLYYFPSTLETVHPHSTLQSDNQAELPSKLLRQSKRTFSHA